MQIDMALGMSRLLPAFADYPTLLDSVSDSGLVWQSSPKIRGDDQKAC
jgi:hypothetical protein